MKKSLFAFVGMAALLASCTNDDIMTVEQGQTAVDLSDGIVFKMGNDAVSRGEFKTDAEGAFYTAWNAEVDKIGVIYTGVAKGIDTEISSVSAAAWCTNGTIDYANFSEASLTGIVTYKTTRSGGFGYFTGDSDEDVLKFAAANTDPSKQVKASFRIFTPAVDPGTSAVRDVKYSTDEDKVPTMKATVAAFDEQGQAGTKVDFNNFFMVADPIDNLWESDLAVGEALTLQFERPFAALAIRTKGYDKDVYGVLKKVTVTMDESNIAYSDESSVDIAKKDKNGKWAINAGTGTKNVVLKINNETGVEWSDDAYAFIQILPVDRSEMKVAEDYTVNLEFANGTISFEKSTKNNWTANSFIGMELNLDAQPYTYLETSKKLIVNSAMPTIDASGKFNGTIDADKITTFVSKVALSANDLKTLKEKFIGVTDLTLANQAADLGDNLANLQTAGTMTTLTLTEATTAPVITSYTNLATLNLPKVTAVPAGAFKGNTTLTNVSMPLVQTIGDNAFEGATKLTTIGCATGDKIIIGTTDKDGVKTSALTSVGAFAFSGVPFTTIDAPELTTIGTRTFGTSALTGLTSVLLPKYDYADAYNAMALLGATSLQTVDLSGVAELGLTSISFNSTYTSLATVTLKEGVKIGASSFMGCSVLATVNNLEKAAEIGEKAFSGTAIAEAELHVATIGKEAFKDCQALATVTLGAEVKTIGEGAFQSATDLNLINNLALVESIGKNAFNGCTGITTFDYTNATLGEGAFNGCTNLVGQVRSNVTTLEKDVFKGANKVSTFVFPNVTTIKEGALQNLLSSSPNATITFGAELTSIDGKAFTSTIDNTTGKDGSSVEKAMTGSVNYNIVLTGDQSNLTIGEDNKITYKATDGKYYAITFASVK